MTSPHIQQGQPKPIDLLTKLSRTLLGTGKKVETMPDNTHNEASVKVFKAIQNAASTSQDLSEFPEKLRIALGDENFLALDSVEVEAVIEYADKLNKMRSGRPNWSQQAGGFEKTSGN